MSWTGDQGLISETPNPVRGDTESRAGISPEHHQVFLAGESRKEREGGLGSCLLKTWGAQAQGKGRLEQHSWGYGMWGCEVCDTIM